MLGYGVHVNLVTTLSFKHVTNFLDTFIKALIRRLLLEFFKRKWMKLEKV